MNRVNILGTEYTIKTKKYDEEEAFKRDGIDGYCDGYTKEIVVCDLKTEPEWKHEEDKTIVLCGKYNLRHEIVHAFLYESGLSQDSNSANAWATNEEMVDWIARQEPKIYKAFSDADAI